MNGDEIALFIRSLTTQCENYKLTVLQCNEWLLIDKLYVKVYLLIVVVTFNHVGTTFLVWSTSVVVLQAGLVCQKHPKAEWIVAMQVPKNEADMDEELS